MRCVIERMCCKGVQEEICVQQFYQRSNFEVNLNNNALVTYKLSLDLPTMNDCKYETSVIDVRSHNKNNMWQLMFLVAVVSIDSATQIK